MYTLLVHPDEARRPTTWTSTISTCVEFYRTASELSHVDVYSEAKRAAVSRVHAVVVYRVQKRVNTNVAAPMD
jgi:hypothetical protein